jgi:hypothetical protein
MRLVLRHIEVADPEGEIDRIDVLERGGKTRQMEREESEGQNAGGGPR